MRPLLFFFIVATTNLLAGFAYVVWLGWQAKQAPKTHDEHDESLAPTADAIAEYEAQHQSDAADPTAEELPEEPASFTDDPPEDDPPAEDRPESDVPTDDAPEIDPPSADAPTSNSAEESPPDEPPAAVPPTEEPSEIDLPADDPPKAEDPSDDELSSSDSDVFTPAEKALGRMQSQTKLFREVIFESQASLNKLAAAVLPDVIGKRVALIQQKSEEYAKQRDTVLAVLVRQHQDRPEFTPTIDELKSVIERQSEQIEAFKASAAEIASQEDLSVACRKTARDANLLLSELYRTRDAISATEIAINRIGGRLAQSASANERDELTGLPGIASVEINLASWWQKDPHRMRQLSLALIDVDQIGKLNEERGHAVADQAINAISGLFKLDAENGDSVARTKGARFCLIIPSHDPKFASNIVEEFRQKVEVSKFKIEDGEFQMTVSCGVVSVSEEDTTESLLARAEKAIAEAKLSGRNRTIIHDGKTLTPIVPRNLSLPENEIVL